MAGQSAQLAELTVPVRGDLTPLRADLAAARRELDAFNKSIGGAGGASSGASASMNGLKRDLSAANDNAKKLTATFTQMGGAAKGSFANVWVGVNQMNAAVKGAAADFNGLAAAVGNVGDQAAKIPKIAPPVVDGLDKAAKVSKNLAWQQRNLSMQLLDTGQSLALGMPFLQVFLQQGPQIAQIWGTNEGGIGRAFKESGSMILGFVTKFPVLTAAVAASGIAIFNMKRELVDAGHKAITYGDILTGLWKTISDGISTAFSPLMDTLKPVFDWIGTAVHATGNLIIKSFLDVYNDLKYIFVQIPNVVALGIANATNMVIDGVNSMTKYVITSINSLSTAINGMLSKIPGYDAKEDGLGTLDPNLGQITDRPKTDKIIADMQAQLKARNDRHNDITNGDPLGDFYDAWKENSVEAMNERLSKKKKKGSKDQAAEAYKKIITDSKQFIAQQYMEADALGMTEEAAAKMKYEQELLNKAQDANIKLTPQQTEELKSLAAQMAEAEERTRKMTEAYNFGKDTFKGFFSDLKQNLQDGKGLWESFGDAAANALQKVADKALDMATDGIWNMIWNSFGGALFGGGGGFNLGAGATAFTGVQPFANGTSYAPGGWSLVGEKGPELLKMAGGSQVIPNNRMNAPQTPSFGGGSGGRGDVTIIQHLSANGDESIKKIAYDAVQDGLDEYDNHKLPQSMARVQQNPRQR